MVDKKMEVHKHRLIYGGFLGSNPPNESIPEIKA